MRVRLMRATTGMAGLALTAVLVSACAGGPPPPDPIADSAPVAVTLTAVATADAPTAAVAGPDGTLWIVERAGRVRVLDGGDLGPPVLDISAETTTEGERGLLGIAFDAGFTRFYLSYTDVAGNTKIDEITVAGGQLQPDTRRTLLTQEQPFSNHNGGDLTVGPDGMLYIGLGDGGSGGDPLGAGQDLGTFLGKLLRIDPAGDPYTVPADNPFADDPAARGEIWAYGLRNPWRFSFDAATGDLWIGDVGQDAREEVDRIPAGTGGGQNFGWSRMEGTRAYGGGTEPEGHVPPVYEYATTGDRCSVTGGYVYRGSAIADLDGFYVFSDYCEGTIRALETRDGEVVGEADLGIDGGAVVAFAQGPDRELYVLDLDGAIYRLDPA
jgi:glucose/arabinose dehydrogenase